MIQNLFGLIVAFQVPESLVISILHLNLIISTLFALLWMYQIRPPSSTPDQLYQLGYKLYFAGYASLILDLVCTVTALIFGIGFWNITPTTARISTGLSFFIYAFIPIIITTFGHVEDKYLEIFFERGRLIVLGGEKLPEFIQKRKTAIIMEKKAGIDISDSEDIDSYTFEASPSETETIEATDTEKTSFEKFVETYFGRLYQLYEKKTVQLSLWRLELDFVKKCLIDPQITAKFRFLS